MTPVTDLGIIQPYLRNNTTQEQISFVIPAKHTDRAPAHKAKVGMIIHDIHPHLTLKGIEEMRTRTLEPAVGRTVAPDAIYDFLSCIKRLYHFHNGIGIVLKIRIDRNSRITLVLRSKKPGKQHILMSAVMGERYAFHAPVGLVEFLDDIPGTILASVVTTQNKAVGGGNSLIRHMVYN